MKKTLLALLGGLLLTGCQSTNEFSIDYSKRVPWEDGDNIAHYVVDLQSCKAYVTDFDGEGRFINGSLCTDYKMITQNKDEFSKTYRGWRVKYRYEAPIYENTGLYIFNYWLERESK